MLYSHAYIKSGYFATKTDISVALVESQDSGARDNTTAVGD
jgi:hypothetical protein